MRWGFQKFQDALDEFICCVSVQAFYRNHSSTPGALSLIFPNSLWNSSSEIASSTSLFVLWACWSLRFLIPLPVFTMSACFLFTLFSGSCTGFGYHRFLRLISLPLLYLTITLPATTVPPTSFWLYCTLS